MNSLGVGVAVGKAGCHMFMGSIEAVSCEGAAEDTRVVKALSTSYRQLVACYG